MFLVNALKNRLFENIFRVFKHTLFGMCFSISDAHNTLYYVADKS